MEQRHPVRISRPTPEPVDAPFALERLNVLVHELSNLLDGSLRCLSQARQAVGVTLQVHGAGLEGAAHHLEVVQESLRRMADLVKGALSSSVPLGFPGLASASTITLGAAAAHAIDVLTPQANEAGTVLRAELPPDLAETPAGPLYGVILNALRNALESVARAGGAGQVVIAARTRGKGEDRWIHVEIRDDGLGPPRGLDRGRVFEPGFSTRPGSAGLGLSIAEAIVKDLGGTIDLSEGVRSRPAAPPPARPGAVLSISYPLPDRSSEAA